MQFDAGGTMPPGLPQHPVKPPRLREGDVVGVVSPSPPVRPGSQRRLEAGVAALEALGLRVRVPDSVHDRHSYRAGSAEARAAAFMAAWRDPDVRMVLMSQGGQTANGILDKLDYSAFASDPKIFMGMSDGTTLVSALSSRSGIVTYHGPDLLFGLGRPMRAEVIEQVRQVLFGADAVSLCTSRMRVHRSGRASGPLVGGHLNILLATMLAGYGPSFEGALLFLEGTHPVDELDRQLTVLRLHGVLDRIAGLVLGHFDRPALADPGAEVPVAEVALDVSAGHTFPIIEIEDLGHRVDNIVLPVGVKASIDTTSRVFRLDEVAVA